MIAAGALLLIAALAGCGGDNNDNNATTTQEQTTGGAAGQTVNVSETDFKLNPSDPKVKAGVVEFKVTNDGQTGHSLEVEGPGEESKLAKTLQPGESGTLKVNLSKAGKYEWYCPIDGHKAMGMKGEITVTGSSAGGSAATGTGSSGTDTSESGGTDTSESGGNSGGGGGY
jgi:uncharacterized cupredoxin-like copper-binding protein